MKKIVWLLLALLLAACFFSTKFGSVRVSADESSPTAKEEIRTDTGTESESRDAREETVPKDKDNPGLHWLEQAVEEKLRSTGPQDFGRVIAIAQRARKEGLSGDNLKFCDELIASEQLQRGLLMAQQIVDQPPGNVTPAQLDVVRMRILGDLESAIKIIKDQPLAYLRIAQLNLLPYGNAKRATEALKQAERTSKNDPALYARVLHLKAMMEKDPEKREKMIAQASKTMGDPRLRLLHAMSLIDLNRYDEALETLKEVLRQEPDNRQALAALFDVLLKQQKLKEALEVLDAIEKIEPGDQLTLQRARIYVALDRSDEAIKLMDELRDKNPDDASILGIRATMFQQLKEYEKALQDVDAALRIVPGQTPLLLLKAQLFLGLNRHEAAAAILEEVYKENSDKEEFAILVVQTYIAANKHDNALDFVTNLRKKNPENPRWTALKAQVLIDMKQPDAAIEMLETFCREHPNDTELKLMLIGILSATKKSVRALKYLEPILEKSPEDLNLLRIRGQLLLSSNLHADAVQTLEKVVKADPKDEVSMNNLSWILSTSPIDMIRDGKRALDLAKQACELTEYKKSYILSTLAAAYAELGNFEQAIEWSQKSIALSQEDEEVKDRVDELQKELDSYKSGHPYREALTEKDE